MHPNLTQPPLTKAHGAFIARHFVIRQLFMRILNTNSLLKLQRGGKISDILLFRGSEYEGFFNNSTYFCETAAKIKDFKNTKYNDKIRG